MTNPPVLVRVDAAAALDPTRAPVVQALWDTGRVDALVLGRRDAADTDPSTVAADLGARHPQLDLVIEADLAHDFPYNLARRVASLQALHGRAPGVLLTRGDRDGVAALHRLWQSWPRASILGDRASRTFVDIAQLRRVDQGGRHPVAGPLQTPVDQGDLPLVLQPFDPERAEESAYADVLVVGPGTLGIVPDGRPVLLQTDAAGLRAAACGQLDGHVAGILADDDLDALLGALTELAPAAHRSAGPRGLRRRFGGGAPRVRLQGTRPFQPAVGKA